jgi:lysine-specific demethylase 8
MYENIERIKAPTKEVFINEYLLKQKPVILTDLFDGQPIREISSLEAARELVGDMPITLQERHAEYFRRMVRGMLTNDFDFLSIGVNMRPSTVNEYMAMVERDPKLKLVSAEVPASMIRGVSSRYTVPGLCAPEPGEPDEFRSMLWMGHGNNYTHLHFDADCRNIFQYQLFGEKRVVLVPPTQSRKLLPLRNHASVSPEGLTEAANDEFVRYVNGYQAIVRTGDTLFMPAAMWHYFEYRDFTMALTMRFRRNKYTRFFGDNLHLDSHLQSIAWRFVNERAIGEEHLKAFAEIQDAYNQPCDNPIEKGQHMQQVFERVHAWFCKEDLQGNFGRPFLEEFREPLRNLEILQHSLYSGEQRAA